MALIRNKDWLKLVGREEIGKEGKTAKLWRVGKAEKVGFKARKNLIPGESASKGWKVVELKLVSAQLSSLTVLNARLGVRLVML